MRFNEDELGDLLERAKWGSVPASTVAELANALKQGAVPVDQRYSVLHIVARAGGPQYETLISKFLDSESDPMLARLALQALCDWLELTERYRDRLVEFSQWVPWDHSDDVRQMAVSLAGKYLAGVDDQELLEILVATAENPAEMAITRDEAIRALARSLGETPDTHPPATQIQDPDSPWSLDVLGRARLRLARMGGETSPGD